MCGLAGFLDRGNLGTEAPVGSILLEMLNSLACRGPDSAGVAIFGASQEPNLNLRVKLCEQGDFQMEATAILAMVARQVSVLEEEIAHEYLRLLVGPVEDVATLLSQLENHPEDLELVSVGRQLDILKQVGSPSNLDASYDISSLTGSHGIGHTRLSTESRIDLSHSQPFGAHGIPDLATVHNGHITNYHKLRRHFEQMGVHFFTDNDSEIIGVYLRHQLAQGLTFQEALESSLDDFDGSFCYLAASACELAYAKDRFGLKPLLVAESDDWVAIATEERAMRSAFSEEFEVLEPGVNQVGIWSLVQTDMERV